MAFSITNVGKAKGVLKKVNFDKVIVGGNSAKLSVKAEEVLKEILINGEYEIFETLDKAGRLLKESLLTRSTSHKIYDFSSIQSISSRNLQQLYKYVLDNKYEDVFDDKDKPIAVLDKSKMKELDALSKKLAKSLNAAIKVIKNNPPLLNLVEQDLKSIGSNSAVFDKLKSKLPKDVGILKLKNYKDAAGHNGIDKRWYSSEHDRNIADAKDIARNHMVGDILNKKVAITLASASLATMVTATALELLGTGAVVTAGVALFGAGLVIILPAVAALLIGMIIFESKEERFGTIAAKKELIKINDEVTNALKCLNKAADLVRKNVKTTTPEGNQEPQPTDDQKTVLKSFVEEQKKLWKPYTTPQGREYNKTEKDKEKGTHKTGLITVKDVKTGTIGKMKEGISKTWVEMSLDI
ncbi:MAG: hypothetical protein Q4D57_02615 [Clostridia bacterium]|nr:hypothetical protein [Clostridia bacterium]